MPRSFHNIEKSAFRPGQYVGYGGGEVFRIHPILMARGVRGWRLSSARVPVNPTDYIQIDRRTLAALSEYLDGLKG